ncbi:MAG: helix-turn-helix domain-containing protein [Myxococcaceae bacterium]
MSPSFLSVREVADRLRVHRSTVYALCDRGELVHVRVSNAIRISAEALDAFLRTHATSAKHRSSAKVVVKGPDVPSA